MTTPKETKSVTLAALTGVGIGLAAGVLLAPKSGKETRQDLKDAGENLIEDFEKKYSEVQASLAETIEQALGHATSLSGTAQEAFNDLIDQAKQAEFKVKDAYREMKHSGSNNKNLSCALEDAEKAKDCLAKFLKK
jgi:gas vesicle protein